MELFNRVIQVIIEWNEGTEKKTVTIPDSNLRRIGFSEELKVNFKVQKTDGKETNEAEINIFNLSSDTRKSIEDAKSKNRKVDVSLLVGYGRNIKDVIDAEGKNSLNRIFFGNLLSYKNESSSTDIITNLICKDGWKGLDQVISLSFDEGTTTSQIINKIASIANFTKLTDKEYDIPDLVYNNGFSYIGKISNALNKVINRIGYEWSIRNNSLLITNINESKDALPVVVLNKDSGLILRPVRVKQDAVTEKGGNKKTFDGWEVKSLIVPGLDVKSLIRMQIQELGNDEPRSDNFVVKTIVFTGSNRENDFIAEMEVVKSATV